MNVRQPLVNTPGLAGLSVEVAQEGVFTAATDTGFRVYSLDAGKLILKREFEGSLGFATPLGASNLFGLIGGGPSPHYPPNKFVLWADGTGKEAFKVETPLLPIRACLTRTHYALTFENGLLIYRLALDRSRANNSSQRSGRYETAPNPSGLCCLGNKRAIFPGRTKGQVQILDLSSRRNNIFPAHSSGLQAMALSADEELLATSSAQGTLIRVWSTRDSAKICEFRRGLDRAIIFSLAFSPGNRALAVTSDKSTLHIFDLPLPAGAVPDPDPTLRTTTLSSRTAHSRNSSTSAKPHQPPYRTATSPKRLSFAPPATHSTSPSRRPRQDNVDRLSLAPSDSVSQAGAGLLGLGSTAAAGYQPAWNDMLRQQPQGRAAPGSLFGSEAVSDASGGSTGNAAAGGKGKYGGLAKLPFAPRILSDTYSSLSCPFEMGDESGGGTAGLLFGATGRPPKGRIGWVGEDELVVIGGGRDARWEKFRIGFDVEGRRGIERVGWKRYLEDEGLG